MYKRQVMASASVSVLMFIMFDSHSLLTFLDLVNNNVDLISIVETTNGV